MARTVHLGDVRQHIKLRGTRQRQRERDEKRGGGGAAVAEYAPAEEMPPSTSPPPPLFHLPCSCPKHEQEKMQRIKHKSRAEPSLSLRPN